MIRTCHSSLACSPGAIKDVWTWSHVVVGTHVELKKTLESWLLVLVFMCCHGPLVIGFQSSLLYIGCSCCLCVLFVCLFVTVACLSVVCSPVATEPFLWGSLLVRSGIYYCSYGCIIPSSFFLSDLHCFRKTTKKKTLAQPSNHISWTYYQKLWWTFPVFSLKHNTICHDGLYNHICRAKLWYENQNKVANFRSRHRSWKTNFDNGWS